MRRLSFLLDQQISHMTSVPFFHSHSQTFLSLPKKLKYNWNDATCWDALSCKFCRCSGWHVGRWAREEAFQCSWNGREEIIPFSSFLLISIQSLTSSSSQDKILSQPTTLFLFYKPQRERKILSNYIKLSFISGEMEVKSAGVVVTLAVLLSQQKIPMVIMK